MVKKIQGIVLLVLVLCSCTTKSKIEKITSQIFLKENEENKYEIEINLFFADLSEKIKEKSLNSISFLSNNITDKGYDDIWKDPEIDITFKETYINIKFHCVSKLPDEIIITYSGTHHIYLIPDWDKEQIIRIEPQQFRKG
jgi:hypothetical protein